MKRKMTKKMLLTLLTGVGLISSVALPLTMTSCGSNDSGKNNNSQPSNPDNKPPVQETITLNVQPSDEVFRNCNIKNDSYIINRSGTTIGIKENRELFLQNLPKNTGDYKKYFFPINEYFKWFCNTDSGLYNEGINQKLFDPDNTGYKIYNNVDLAANIMMKHIMNDGLIWLFFDISEQDWLKIKDEVDLTFGFTRQDKIVNGSLTIKEKPNSNLKLEGNSTSTFSFELDYRSSGVTTGAPLYVDINSAKEQTAENVVAQLTKYLENNLFMSRSQAWEYENNQYPTIDDYKNTIKSSPKVDDWRFVSYKNWNGYGLKERPEWFNLNNEYVTMCEFFIEKLSKQEVAKLVGFISGTDILNSFNYKLGLSSTFESFRLALYTGRSIFYNSGEKIESFSFSESSWDGINSNFNGIRLIDTNKQIGFSGILKMLPHNSKYIEENKEVSNLFGEEIIKADIGKMFEDGLFEQFRNPSK